jgi:hypothetical protein
VSYQVDGAFGTPLLVLSCQKRFSKLIVPVKPAMLSALDSYIK